MKVERISEDRLVLELRREAQQPGGMAAAARRLGFAPPFIGDVLHGRRPVSDRLAAALGWPRRRVYFERDKTETGSADD